MGPWAHGPMDPWTHGPMGPWTHGPMGPRSRTTQSHHEAHNILSKIIHSFDIFPYIPICQGFIFICQGLNFYMSGVKSLYPLTPIPYGGPYGKVLSSD
mgnify:CR=1 FL=1